MTEGVHPVHGVVTIIFMFDSQGSSPLEEAYMPIMLSQDLTPMAFNGTFS